MANIVECKPEGRERGQRASEQNHEVKMEMSSHGLATEVSLASTQYVEEKWFGQCKCERPEGRSIVSGEAGFGESLSPGLPSDL